MLIIKAWCELKQFSKCPSLMIIIPNTKPGWAGTETKSNYIEGHSVAEINTFGPIVTNVVLESIYQSFGFIGDHKKLF